MTILDSFKDALQRNASLRVNQDGEYTPYDLKVIVALFMLSAAHSDGFIHQEERVEALKVLSRQFGFTDEQGAQVIDVAEFLLDKDHSIEEFAAQVKENFEEPQRITLLAMYIRVIEADGVVNTKEMKQLEKILALLNLTHAHIDVAKEKIEAEAV